jgi:hypothetical protein
MTIMTPLLLRRLYNRSFVAQGFHLRVGTSIDVSQHSKQWARQMDTNKMTGKMVIHNGSGKIPSHIRDPQRTNAQAIQRKYEYVAGCGVDKAFIAAGAPSSRKDIRGPAEGNKRLTLVGDAVLRLVLLE